LTANLLKPGSIRSITVTYPRAAVLCIVLLSASVVVLDILPFSRAAMTFGFLGVVLFGAAVAVIKKRRRK